ncbi:MAG: hypothetical protein QM747_15725 [Nocardioides sp.]
MARSRWMVWVLGLALVPVVATAGSPSYAAPAHVRRPYVSIAPQSVIEFDVLRRPVVRIALNDHGYAFPPSGDTYELQVSRTPMRATRRAAWHTFAERSALGLQRVHVAPGRVLCFRARTHRDGVTSGRSTSAWTRRECFVQPLGDEQVKRQGRMRVRPDKHFSDGHSTVLCTGGRLLLPHVPRGASYGPVYVNNGVLNDGHDQPEWWILGHRHPYQSANGGFSGELQWNAKVAREPGTAVITTESPYSEPIGGVVVIPKWL